MSPEELEELSRLSRKDTWMARREAEAKRAEALSYFASFLADGRDIPASLEQDAYSRFTPDELDEAAEAIRQGRGGSSVGFKERRALALWRIRKATEGAPADSLQEPL